MREGDKTGRVTSRERATLRDRANRRERATGGERVRIESESWYT